MAGLNHHILHVEIDRVLGDGVPAHVGVNDVGLLVLAVLPPINLDGFVVERDMRLIIGVAVLMVTVGLLAAAGPVRRGLQIQPAESLREQ